MREFDELNQELKEMVRDLISNPGSQEYFSKEFKGLSEIDLSDPLETSKEMIFTGFKEIQVKS